MFQYGLLIFHSLYFCFLFFFPSPLRSSDGGNTQLKVGKEPVMSYLVHLVVNPELWFPFLHSFLVQAVHAFLSGRSFSKAAKTKNNSKRAFRKVSFQLCDVHAYHKDISLDARPSFVFSINRKKIHCPFYKIFQ